MFDKHDNYLLENKLVNKTKVKIKKSTKKSKAKGIFIIWSIKKLKAKSQPKNQLKNNMSYTSNNINDWNYGILSL